MFEGSVASGVMFEKKSDGRCLAHFASSCSTPIRPIKKGGHVCWRSNFFSIISVFF